ncbi:MAG: hypothetical protein KIT58_17010 [Planctomycetota bacterium]|nr:hypothetical protein [Planctomycetota bacterium]
MSCASVRPLLAALAVDALDDEAEAAAREHVAGCAACADERDLLAGLLAVEDDDAPPPPDDVWERIEAAIGRDLVVELPPVELSPVELPPVEEPAPGAAPA